MQSKSRYVYNNTKYLGLGVDFIFAVERSKRTHYSYRIQQVRCWWQVLEVQNHDFRMIRYILTSVFVIEWFVHSVWFPLYFSCIMVEHIHYFRSNICLWTLFLSNESSAKTLATCISHFSVEYQKGSVFVPSGLHSLAPAVLAGCTPIPRYIRSIDTSLSSISCHILVNFLI